MSASKRNQVLAALRTAEQEATYPHGMGDGTAMRIYRETGMGEQNIRSHLEKLASDRQAYIFCWTDTVPRAPVWVAGSGEHAPKPLPLSESELRQRKKESQRRRHLKLKEAREPGWARQATYACIERVRQTPQSWCSPLMSAA